MRGELFSSEMKIAQDFEVNTERKEKTMKELEKTYNPSAIEEKLYQKWLDNKYFHADAERGKREGKKPFTIVMPPPNITGQLHNSEAPLLRDQTFPQFHSRFLFSG